ncbi:type III pantothenate kinase [Wohlfahrtiimonas larvae]|nr:type III pantothenate kinase [Wohlfahrtiimonas larvae]
MPKFLFDCGNTCIKFALFTEEKGLSQYQFIDYSVLHSFVTKLFNLYPMPDEIKISSVTKVERLNTLLSDIAEFTALQPTIAISQNNALGLTNQYDIPQTLGVDRWLGMLAAWDIYHESTLVVDLGTALTIDYVTHDGKFEGGLIMPGIKSLRDALLKDTAIKNIPELPYTSELGHNTSACISSGIHYAVVGSILALHQSLPEVKSVILSGGRAQWLKDILEPILPKTEYHVHKHLVLEGLLRFQA